MKRKFNMPVTTRGLKAAVPAMLALVTALGIYAFTLWLTVR